MLRPAGARGSGCLLGGRKPGEGHRGRTQPVVRVVLRPGSGHKVAHMAEGCDEPAQELGQRVAATEPLRDVDSGRVEAVQESEQGGAAAVEA